MHQPSGQGGGEQSNRGKEGRKEGQRKRQKAPRPVCGSCCFLAEGEGSDECTPDQRHCGYRSGGGGDCTLAFALPRLSPSSASSLSLSLSLGSQAPALNPSTRVISRASGPVFFLKPDRSIAELTPTRSMYGNSAARAVLGRRTSS